MNEDNELMEMVKDGDNSAYETLVIKHRKSAIHFANTFVSDLYTADDIVQESFIKVYIHRMDYKPSHTFKTYLFTIIRNCCIDYIRLKKRHGTEELVNLNLHSNFNPENITIKNEQLSDVYRHFESLSDDYKTALYLFAEYEMSYADIAKIMRKSIAQVKITIYRARKKMKNLCEGVDHFEK